MGTQDATGSKGLERAEGMAACASTYCESKKSENRLHPGQSQLCHRRLYVQYRGAETDRFWKLVYQYHSQHVHTLTHTFKHTHGKKGTDYSGDTMHIAVGTASGYW